MGSSRGSYDRRPETGVVCLCVSVNVVEISVDGSGPSLCQGVIHLSI